MKRIFMMLLGVLSTLYTTAETGYLYENNENDNATTRCFKGVVLDENGTPLPGASIVVIGTTIGAGTNTQGEFTLSLRDKGFPILRASFIGYTPVEYKIHTPETDPKLIGRGRRYRYTDRKTAQRCPDTNQSDRAKGNPGFKSYGYRDPFTV